MTPELTQENTSIPSSVHEAPERLSPGALIRRARERARMAPEELAAQTKLSRSTLDALERDDFNTLIEPVYVRGYYRKCAKVLDVSERELLDAYEARVAPRSPQLPSKLRLASGTDLGTGSRLPIPLAAVGAIAAIVICALIWFARGEPNNSVPPAVSAKADAMTPDATPHIPVAVPVAEFGQGTPSVKAATVAAKPLGALETAPVPTPAISAPAPFVAPVVTPQMSPPSTPALLAPALTPAPKPAAPIVTTAPPSVAPATAPVSGRPLAGSTMVLNFSITSWARVDDASGKTLLNGLMRAGEKQSLNGTAPFTVFLGNAPGVRADLNGKSVDLTKYTAANNTARFTLGGKP